MDPASAPTSCLNPGVPPIRSWEQLGDLVDGGWGEVVMFWGKGDSKFCSVFGEGMGGEDGGFFFGFSRRVDEDL